VFGRSFQGTGNAEGVSKKWEKGEKAGKRAFHFLSWEVIGNPVFTPAAATEQFPYRKAIYITQKR
jgi:hypothetical protein